MSVNFNGQNLKQKFSLKMGGRGVDIYSRSTYNRGITVHQDIVIYELEILYSALYQFEKIEAESPDKAT